MGDLRVSRLCGVPRHRGRGRSAIIGMPSCYVGEIQVSSSEAEGMRGCFEVERRSVDKCRWLSGCRREDDDRRARYKCGGREDLFTADPLGRTWLALAVRACKTTQAQEPREQARQLEVCGVWCW